MKSPLYRVAGWVLGGTLTVGFGAVAAVKHVSGCGLSCPTGQECKENSGSGVFGLDYSYTCRPKPSPSPSASPMRGKALSDLAAQMDALAAEMEADSRGAYERARKIREEKQ